jgi:pimeloyl-ACP methyl ester carboxylesterase
VLDKSTHADLVTHDIGNMIGYAYAAQYPGA